MDAPEHRRCPNGREQAGGATLELYKGRRCIAPVGWQLLRGDAGVHFGDWPGQVHERIEHMQAGPGHAAARRLAWIVAPAPFHTGRMLIAEIALDMKNFAQCAVCDGALELTHARKAAFVVAEGEGHTSLDAGGDSALGLDPGER